jgi:uncharacterized protein (TIGR02266 family)
MGSKKSDRHDRERRSKPRYHVDLEVNYRHGDAYLYCRSTNASEFGIFLVTDQPLPMGSTLTMLFKEPHAREPLTVQGEVRWIDDGSAGEQPGMGIRFVGVQPNERQRIRNLIRIVARID